MTWEGFTNWLTNISHNPVFISIVSIISGLLSVLVIIAKTSVGRKALKQLTSLGRNTQDKVITLSAKVESNLKNIDATLRKINEEKEAYLKEVETKFRVFYSQFNFYETQLIEVLKMIPNAKIKAKVELIETEWSNKKKDIESFVGITYNEMQDKFSDLEKQIEELKNGREAIDNQTKEE